MINKATYIALKIDTDTANDKRSDGSAYNIHNLEVTNNGGSMSLSAVKENSAIPGTETVHTLHASVEIDGMLFLFISLGHESNLARIMYYNETADTLDQILLTNQYFGDKDKVVDLIANKENSNIIKLYWAFEGNQLSNFNVFDSDYFGGDIDSTVEYNAYNIKPVSMFNPLFQNKLEGGNIKAGRRQYAYSMFNLGGSETTISPLCELIAISKNYEGGESGEVMPVSIELLLYPDTANYKYIRIFSIHYEELDQIPEINLIVEIEAVNPLTFIDDGNLFLSTYSMEQFLFLGGVLIEPKTIATKNNILFAGNYKNPSFDVEFSNFRDCRMFAFNASNSASVEDVEGNYLFVEESNIPDGYDVFPEEFDCINVNRLNNKFQSDGVTLGASGRNFEMSFVTKTSVVDDNVHSLKQGEIYRLGVVFFDEFMRASPTKWMIDFQVPRYADFNSNVGVHIEFIGVATYFTEQGAKSYQMVIAERKPSDRTLSSQGFINPGAEYNWTDTGDPVGGDPAAEAITPYYTLKRIVGGVDPGGDMTVNFTNLVDINANATAAPDMMALPLRRDDIQFFYSSDTIFDIQNVQTYDKVIVQNIISTADLAESITRLRIFEDGGVQGTSEVAGTIYITPTGTFPGLLFPDYMLHELRDDGGVSNYEHIISHVFDTVEAAADPGTITLGVQSKVLQSNASDRIDSIKVATSIDLPKMIHSTFESGGIYFFSSYKGAMADCVVLKFATDDWHILAAGSPYSIFKDKTALTADEACLPIVELSRTVSNQYGGNSYAAKQTSTYLLKGEVTSFTSHKDHYLGDTFIGPMIINRHDGLDSRIANYRNLYDYVYGPNVEHNVDVNSRYDYMYSRKTGLGGGLLGSFRLDDNHELLGAYNQRNNLKTTTGKSPLFRDVSEFDTSIMASSPKYPNESVDSWTDFNLGEIMELMGTYGELNKLYNFKNQIYGFQNTATCQILIQPHTQIQTNTAVGVELGTGAILYSFEYINTKSGCISMRGIADDGNTLIYYDNATNSVNALPGNEMTSEEFVSTLMASLKPANPREVTFLYSINRHEFMLGFNDSGKQLVYNTIVKGFQRTQDGFGYLFAFKGEVYQKQNYVEDSIYKMFGGVARLQGEVSYIFAPDSKADKVFQFIEFRPRGSVHVVNIQATGAASLGVGSIASPKENSKFGITRIHMPRIDNNRMRFRDTSIKVDLSLTFGDESYLDEMTVMYSVKG